jgi:hypothetical protein
LNDVYQFVKVQPIVGNAAALQEERIEIRNAIEITALELREPTYAKGGSGGIGNRSSATNLVDAKSSPLK